MDLRFGRIQSFDRKSKILEIRKSESVIIISTKKTDLKEFPIFDKLEDLLGNLTYAIFHLIIVYV